MAETIDANQEVNEWGDVTGDALFQPVTKILAWSGFALLAIALVTMSVLGVVNHFHEVGEFEDQTGTDPTHGSIDTMVIFSIVYNVGAVVFGGALVFGALAASRAPQWARITMLAVAGLLLIGTNALATINLN